MRIAVVVLVLVNVVLFVYARLDSAAQSETSRLSQQVAPERIKLLTPSDVAALSPTKAAALPDVCAEWGPFADADRAHAEGDLAPLALGRTLSQRTVATDAQYWVNLGGMQNRAAADRRAAELRAQAISDLSVVDYPRGQFTVSLGVFRTQAAANARAETLAARGVLGTQVEPRTQSGAAQAMLVVRDPPQPVVARLKELSAQYAGTDVKVGPCVPTS
ncbi:MAG TPA: SPOR domain-containing protein [Casimicrobiaceae bacterium]|nr:SPOR domain-containing protein [Casimicrobiaceae bacterium]